LPFSLFSLAKVGFSSSSSRHRQQQQQSTVDERKSKSVSLYAWGNKKKNMVEPSPPEPEKNTIWDKVSSNIEEFKDEIFQKILSMLPMPLVELFTKIIAKLQEWLPSIKVAALSFILGGVFMLSAILVPVYSSVETLSEPVTLFETILADLDAGYVDPVDPNKLFETGISAMLRSLDPYTEYESREDAQTLNEGISGKYGGVGLVIAGVTPRDVAEIIMQQQQSSTWSAPSSSIVLPDDGITDSISSSPEDSGSSSGSSSSGNGQSSTSSSSRSKNKGPAKIQFINNDNQDEEELDEEERMVMEKKQQQIKAITKAQQKGIRVVSAFEGYAYDYGLRVGDRLKRVDDLVVTADTTVEDVRNVLRGEPGTMVTIDFERDGVAGIQSVTIPRTIVQLRDVKLATLVGNPSDGIGYISLSGFAASAGPEVRGAILALEQAAEDASNGAHNLKGLILDLRGNPGGLLTSAVDVASLLVPNGSDIVSAKGRGFPGVIYRSRVEPLLDPSTKLAVLVNRGTASAAEIVSGAVQDLDVGVIIGTDRTFGKGLVQNVESLPFDSGTYDNILFCLNGV
jgi:C-terminal peptidase prc